MESTVWTLLSQRDEEGEVMVMRVVSTDWDV